MVARRIPGKPKPPEPEAKLTRRLPGKPKEKWVPRPIRDISTVGILVRKPDPYLEGITEKLKKIEPEEAVPQKLERRLPKVKLHPEVVQPIATYGAPKKVQQSAIAKLTYRSKRWDHNSEAKEVRKYFAGIFDIAIVEFGRKGERPIRAHYSDGECPTLVKEFKSEKRFDEWLIAQLSERQDGR